MIFKAALELPLQDEEEAVRVFVSDSPKAHKFDPATALCVRCLNTRPKNFTQPCPGLLNPSINVEVM